MNNHNKDYIKTEFSTHYLDLTDDYILPDSYKDVKAILSCNESITELNKYFGPADAQISGNMSYNIVFVTAGDNGADEIHSICFNESFKQTCRYTNESNAGAGTVTVPNGSVCRMANPRKFSVKSTLKTTMFEDISCSTYPELEQGCPADAELQYKFETDEILSCYNAELTDHSFSDNIELDMKMPEIEKLVHNNASLYIRDDRNYDLKNSQIKIGGIFALNIIYLDKEGKYQYINKDIPFNVSLNQDELLTLTRSQESILGIYPSVTLSAITFNVGKNQYDESKVIEFDADYNIDMFVFDTHEIEYVSDAYSLRYDCEPKTGNKEFLVGSNHICNNFTNSETIAKVSSGLSEYSCIACISQDIQNIGVNTNGLNAAVCTKLICTDENANIRSKDMISEFNYRCTIPEAPQMMGRCFAPYVKVRFDDEKIYTDCEVYIDYSICEKQNKNVCTQLSVNDTRCKECSEIFSIYFPSEKETIWDCAKAKKKAISSIMSSNRLLSDEALLPIVIE